MYCNLSQCHLAIFQWCLMIPLISLLVYPKRNATLRLNPDLRNLFVNITRFVVPTYSVEGNESSRQVYRYVALVTKSVIPNSFWGSKHNLRLILRCQLQFSLPRLLKSLNSREDVEQFISCRKHESLSLHHVIQGFRTSDCDWLAPSGNVSQKYRMCVSDAKKRKELLEDFLFWYFDGFVSPLLKVIRPRNEIQ